MYIQITTKCNMECDHCCFACTAEGKDMSMKTFKRAVEVAEEYGDVIAIGGGEPTVHPKFWEMLGWCLGADVEIVWLATNGKKRETAIKLARLAKKGIIGCRLSQTQYHEEADADVVKAFDRGPKKYGVTSSDGRELVTGVDNPTEQGRCEDGNTEICVCPETFVKPDGKVYQCGCTDSPCIGNVFDGFDYPDGGCECWKQLADVTV